MKSLPILIAIGVMFCARTEALSICATVTDLPGQPLRHAVVKIINLLQPDFRSSASVDSAGKVCLEHLPEGIYSVEASSSGFLNVRYYPVRLAVPDDVTLAFQLPYGEIREGLLQSEAILSGTLTDQNKPADAVRICLFESDKSIPSACGVTNDLGQYALTVSPAKYRVELTRSQVKIHSAMIDLSYPGNYRNEVTIPSQ
jgi:carboxypeptidase family protein